jgi:hypothetical protein
MKLLQYVTISFIINRGKYAQTKTKEIKIGYGITIRKFPTHPALHEWLPLVTEKLVTLKPNIR